MPNDEGHTFPPEIENRMFIQPMEAMPTDIEPHITEEQLSAFTDESQRRIILAMSRIEQLIYFTYKAQSRFVDQARRREAYDIEDRMKIKQGLWWLTATLIGAIAIAVAEKLIHP